MENKYGDSIATRLARIKSTLNPGVELVAVSKFHPVEELQAAYDAGQRIFGESRVQELVGKFDAMPGDVKWHFIGHLQTNKVKPLIGRVALIESVDSLRLLECIDAHSARAGVVTRVLMQVHVAREETKFGFDPDELVNWFKNCGFRDLKATRIAGIMGMASNTDDQARVAADFHRIAETRNRILQTVGHELTGFDTVSMGMSDDYPLAMACGSNLVRIGTAIFGPREY